jgi:hypothetical protein
MALGEGGCSASLPGPFVRWEKSLGTPFIGNWIGHRSSLDVVEWIKYLLRLQGFEPGPESLPIEPLRLACRLVTIDY